MLQILPIFASTVILNCCLAQLSTFSVQQAATMNTTIASFKLPPASLPVFPIIFMMITAPLYDHIIIPLARKWTKSESGVSHLQRVGIGLCLSILAMAIAGLVEIKRKKVANNYEPGPGPLPISFLWIAFQYLFLGSADLFVLAGLMEFSFSEAPVRMRSLATSFSWASLAMGYYLSGVIVSVVNGVTGRGDRHHGWLSGENLNRYQLERFYGLMFVLSVLNLEKLMKHSTKLDDLIAESLYPVTSSANDYDGRSEGVGVKFGASSIKNGVPGVDKHIDVHEEEGYIIIPCKELPDSWNEKSDMLQFKTLDRPFVFPGEQIQIVACLSTCKQEEYRGQTEELLNIFKNSHFFTRIAESNEALWSRRKTHETNGGKFIPIESCNDVVAVDRGTLDASTSGGIAKNDVKCSQLANGDIVNISPSHAPDIVIYLDSITLVFEEASKGGAPMSLPIACVETGNNHGLPDLPLRKGEEHSFILKPATPLWSSIAGSAGSNMRIFTNVYRGNPPTDKYAVLVSCRCNYTGSRLLFKQPTNWRPHIQKDILISVASQMSKKTLGLDDKFPNLHVQVRSLPIHSYCKA
ncbi:hypothetical protein SSX86_027606 [Deinandra increscens subsp. villosa]|uniref:Proton-dependent oligopeptide transporter family n=1 Tax=Deinandra increscens subsp. villosa TaxID=3103831 RepID=A0AAP0C6D8_9ASTR